MFFKKKKTTNITAETAQKIFVKSKLREIMDTIYVMTYNGRTRIEVSFDSEREMKLVTDTLESYGYRVLVLHDNAVKIRCLIIWD